MIFDPASFAEIPESEQPTWPLPRPSAKGAWFVMKVKEVMNSDYVTIHPQETLAEASEKIQTVGPGPLPVAEKGQLQGMLTDQDVARLKSEARDPSTPVRQVMTPGVLFCYDDQELPEVLGIMKEHQVQKLLVLSRDRQLVGEVSLPALTRAYAGQR